MAFSLRTLTHEDLGAVLRLNNAAAPAVPTATAEELAHLVGVADHGIAVTGEAGEVVGFLVAFEPGRAYASENYVWFEQRGTDHLYVDRIVVDEALRGQRIGALLYDRVFAIARGSGRDEVTCEVNVEPPNPRSLAFHRRLGFAEVGRQQTKGGAVEVALLAASARSTTPS